MTASAEIKRAVVAVSHRLAAKGWIANHDGNVSVRLGDGRFLCTPTAVGKAEVTPELLVIVDGEGKLVAGRAKPFSEMGLHLTVYRTRPDVQAVVHAHPPTATGLCVAGSRLLETPFLYEAVVSLGRSIPLVPRAMPGRSAEEALRPFVSAHDVVLLQNHGVLSWGSDLMLAFYRMELCEHLARIGLFAQQAGGVQPLDEAEVQLLLEARKKAGLGPEARLAAGPPASTAAGQAAPAAAAERPAVGATVIPAPSAKLAEIISQEVARALGPRAKK